MVILAIAFLLYLWVISVIVSFQLSDFLDEYLRSKIESFYYKCWMKRQNLFSRIYMSICDNILDMEVKIFRIKFRPAWAIISTHIFILIYLLFDVMWVKIVFIVAKLFPIEFSWLLDGPLKDIWF